MNCLDSPTEIFVVAWLAFTLLGRVLKAMRRPAPTEPAEEAPSPPAAGDAATAGEGEEAPQIPEAVRRWLESVGIDVGEATGEPGSRPSADRPPDAELEATASQESVEEEFSFEGGGGEAGGGEPEPAWSDPGQQREEADDGALAREGTIAVAGESRAEMEASEFAVSAFEDAASAASEAKAFGAEFIEAGQLAAPAAIVRAAGSARAVSAAAAARAPSLQPAAWARDALVLEAILAPRRWGSPPPARRRSGR